MTYQVRKIGDHDWQDDDFSSRAPKIMSGYEYRIKPEPASPKWPQTTMTYEQIEAAAYNAPMGAQWRGIANSALKHACESGEVVPADKVREIEAKARAEGMKDGSVWISDRDRMIIRETLKSQGISWTSALVDRVVYRLQK